MAQNARIFLLGGIDEASRSVAVVASTKQPVKGYVTDAKGVTTPRFEVLESWNLARFAENNAVLWAHDQCQLPIGWGEEVRETDAGLEMRIRFATEDINPEAERIWKAVKAKLVKGVSVGFDFGTETKETRDGQKVSVFRGNELNEVSIVPVPADARALVGFRAKDHIEAVRADAKDETEHRFDFLGAVSKFERTQVGGLRVPARVTRTGVLDYRRPDGTIRRELRLPEEVFNADSLASLAGATVTDLEHHRGLLNVHNWKDATLGHAEAVRQDGAFVNVDLVVNDARAIADIENGRLHDISCGYSCRLDATPGIYEGKPYDVIQRRIRYNHVAVLPKGKGRAGPDVAMRLDAKDAECVEAPDHQGSNMSEPSKQRVIRIDGRDLDYGSEDHIKHLENAHLADLQKAETDQKALVARCDAAEGKAKDADTRAKKAEDDAKTAKDAEASDEAKAKRRTRERLLRRAIRALVTEDEDTTESENKMDALDDELSQLSNKDLMLRVIRTDAQYADDKDLDDKPEAYIQAIFDGLSKRGVTRNDGIDSVPRAFERVKRVEQQGKKDPLAEARAKSNKTMQDAWKTPLT